MITGPVIYDERTHSFHCLGCFAHIEIKRRVLENPHDFMEQFELVQLDHTECAEYSDVRLAQNARKFRKESKRLQIVAGRVH